MRMVLALLMWSVAASVVAGSGHIYKSEHPDGSVSYSDTRPATAVSVEEMTVDQNSAADEQQGKQRVEETRSTGDRLEKERADEAQTRREYQVRLAAARQQVAEAERYLVATRQSRTNATAQFIGLAEDRVRLARQRLRKVQSAGP